MGRERKKRKKMVGRKRRGNLEDRKGADGETGRAIEDLSRGWTRAATAECKSWALKEMSSFRVARHL
jgi:hypothetical protein